MAVGGSQRRIEIVYAIDRQPGRWVQHHGVDTIAVEHQAVCLLIESKSCVLLVDFGASRRQKDAKVRPGIECGHVVTVDVSLLMEADGFP